MDTNYEKKVTFSGILKMRENTGEEFKMHSLHATPHTLRYAYLIFTIQVRHKNIHPK